MRSLSFPKLSTLRKHDEQESGMASTSPYQFACAHSRNSSGASTESSPITSTFSNRTHNRFPSSTSSLGTSPDSSANPTKSPLHDLMEEPSEREDVPSYTASPDGNDEPLCICDTPFCEHREVPGSQSAILPPANSEWAYGDDRVFYHDTGSSRSIRRDIGSTRSIKRSMSGELFDSKASSRSHSRRWPSISSRWRDKKATTSVSSQTVRSAPPSRTSSLRMASGSQSLAANLETRDKTMLPEEEPHDSCYICAPSPVTSSKPFEVEQPGYAEDPIDREGLSSTPLLPPLLTETRKPQAEPRRSATASLSASSSTASFVDVQQPTSPAVPCMPTPPLSTKPSVSSIGRARSTKHVRSEPQPMASPTYQETWADKLGHSNFEIEPQPYIPQVCTRETCNRLLYDWEAARVEYMRMAARVSEHYGPSSKIYKLSEEKWAGIDAQWRSNLESANAEAEANGEKPAQQYLAETQTLAKMPSLADPQQPAKFPTIDEADIVGPMVQYAKIQPPPSKRANFARLFTDPASLFTRSSGSTRR